MIISTQSVKVLIIALTLPMLGFVAMIFLGLKDGPEWEVLFIALVWLIFMLWFFSSFPRRYSIEDDRIKIVQLSGKVKQISYHDIDEIEVQKTTKFHGFRLSVMKNGGNLVIKTVDGKYSLTFLGNIDEVLANILHKADAIKKKVNVVSVEADSSYPFWKI